MEEHGISGCAKTHVRKLDHARTRMHTCTHTHTHVRTHTHTHTHTHSPPMLLHSSAQGNLLPNLCADRLGQGYLGQVSLNSNHPPPCCQRANVHHQHLILGQLLHLTKNKTTGYITLYICTYVPALISTTTPPLFRFPSSPSPLLLACPSPLTFAPRLSPSVLTPNSRRKRK